ncbi:XRE family transcriptional regulator [Phyllobacterium phragmitis]|nr:XRE family transcriptional regulator [Phyllobacterium phragmitis]
MITGSQCHAARALAEVSRDELALSSGIGAEIIADFEQRIAEPDRDIITNLQSALERAGAVFIHENGGGIGVRLKFTKSDTRRLSVLESEGGIAADDDVP